MNIQTSRGFSLIEILVTLVVLSIGLIALGSLNLFSLRAAQSSYNVSIASSIALDIEERLWILAAQQDFGCIGEEKIKSALKTVSSDWEWQAGKVGLTPAESTAGTTDGSADEESTDDAKASNGLLGDIIVVPHSKNYWTEVSFTVSWNDGRFGTAAEVFPYTARVICAPAADDDASDEPNGEEDSSE